MGNVLEVIKCNEGLLLFQCNHCINAVMLNHVPTLLANLQPTVARSAVHEVLSTSYEESVGDTKPLALAQADVERMKSQRFASLSVPESATAEDSGSNLSDVPPLPEQPDCQPNDKCSIAENPNCAKLRGRFLNVATSLMDRRDDELKVEIGSRSSYCAIQA